MCDAGNLQLPLPAVCQAVLHTVGLRQVVVPPLLQGRWPREEGRAGGGGVFMAAAAWLWSSLRCRLQETAAALMMFGATMLLRSCRLEVPSAWHQPQEPLLCPSNRLCWLTPTSDQPDPFQQHPRAHEHTVLSAGGCVVTHIFFLTSTCPSRRSYSFLILAFSCSSSCSFSRLNSCREAGR
jgi:hypothetical protein